MFIKSFPDTISEPPITEPESALVLPTETDIELLAEDVEVARGYAEKSLSESRGTSVGRRGYESPNLAIPSTRSHQIPPQA